MRDPKSKMLTGAGESESGRERERESIAAVLREIRDLDFQTSGIFVIHLVLGRLFFFFS